jgi:methyl-accepting chemotaxis protein
MTPTLTTIVASATGALIGTTVGAFVVALANGRLKRRLDDLEERRLTQLEGALGKVERTMNELGKDGCRVGTRVSQKLDQVSRQLDRIDAKLDRIAETTAGQDADIRANAQYIRNVDTSLQRHKEMAHNG